MPSVLGALIICACLVGTGSAVAVSTVPRPDDRVYETVVDSTGNLIRELMAAEPDSFARYLSHADQYGIQVIYTRIDRDSENVPTFRQFSWRADRQRYFNPASLVKLPVALVAIERVRRLNIPGLTGDTPMIVRRGPGCETRHRLGEPAVPLSLHIRRMLLVSDNVAYSRVFEIVGQDDLNGRLRELGYDDPVICRRFCRGSWRQNRTANPVAFIARDGGIVHTLPARVSIHEWINPLALVDDGGASAGGKGGPSHGAAGNGHSNYLPLQSINDMLKAVMFPQSRPRAARFDLTEAELGFIRRQLALYPRESGLPEYMNGKEYYDNHKKYFIYGDLPKDRSVITDDAVRIFNIVGRYDGYLADVAYIVDFEKGVEFLLAAVIDTNRNQDRRDGRDEYATEGLPFLARLGRAVYRHECARVREHPPDFGTLLSDLLQP
jgi:hypothetical protein